MLPAPHGGRLVDRTSTDTERQRRISEAKDLPTVQPHVDVLYDAEKIAIGSYSPLEGFMDRESLDAVLDTGRLPNGLPWSIPITYSPSDPAEVATLRSLRAGEEVGFLDAKGRLIALFELEGSFPFDRSRVAQGTYGTVDPAHPNVADLLAMGDTAFSGKVRLVERLPEGMAGGEMTPAETRAEFGRRGWRNVAAYQCRNPPHTAHEYLQRTTLERDDVDGLFVHPVVGRLKKGDYRPDIIIRSYEQLIRAYYPSQRVTMSPLMVTMRYAGPKAALFFAIVRKNYGCGFYIVGRDQAGVGTYYDPYDCHRIFDKFDVGVTPLRYEETFFCRRCGWMASPKTCAHPSEDRVSTSQTRIRGALAAGEPLPMEIIRPEVAKVLQGSSTVLT
jgi:sulfate adenylyltransferase